jgi:hypothetical protein
MTRWTLLAVGLVMVSAVAACSARSWFEEPAPAGTVFPHPAGFEEGSEHGAVALRFGLSACASCHGLLRPTARNGDCWDCHEGYPHVPAWSDATEHGGAYFSAEACDGCHGSDLNGGGSGVGCRDCHAAWPHAEDWGEVEVHGAWLAQRRTLDACAACHDWGPGTEDYPGCGECHEGYPHGKDWAVDHGAAWASGGCSECHGASLGGGLWAPACADCHASYPHSDGWNLDHVLQVEANGEGECLLCHQAPFGPTLAASCTSTCHREAP